MNQAQPDGSPVPVALVVEDEEHARAELCYLLDQSGAAVVEAASATDALDILAETEVSAVFLDIHMPGLDGLQLAQVLGKFSQPPPIVFVTAYEEHAVEAFDLAAIDYLVKPVTAERLARTLARLDTSAGRAGGNGDGDGETGYARGNGHAQASVDELPFVAVEVGDRVILIERAEIRYVEARGDYVRLYTFDHHYLIRRPLSSVARSWDRYGFVRVHRSFVVNLRHVIDISPSFNQSLAVRINNAERTVVPVSRRQASVLRERLGVSGHG
jgi:DNA-binding LytR/AlgR family response regulator